MCTSDASRGIKANNIERILAICVGFLRVVSASTLGLNGRRGRFVDERAPDRWENACLIENALMIEDACLMGNACSMRGDHSSVNPLMGISSCFGILTCAVQRNDVRGRLMTNFRYRLLSLERRELPG